MPELTWFTVEGRVRFKNGQASASALPTGSGSAAAQYGGSIDGNEGPCLRRRRFGEMRKLFGVGLQVLKETLKFPLHRVHLFAHVEDDFDPGQVHPQIAG